MEYRVSLLRYPYMESFDLYREFEDTRQRLYVRLAYAAIRGGECGCNEMETSTEVMAIR